MNRNIAIILSLFLLSSTVQADWLAFKDGTTREIVGHWKVRGQQVIFKVLGGTLSSVRLEEVDLPASEQLSANAQSDRGIVEIKSSPSEDYELRGVLSGADVYAVGDGSAIVEEWFYLIGKQVGTHPALTCVPSRLVGVSSGTEWWLQTGTKISKFRPIGLASADVDRLKALVPTGLLCIEADAKVKSPEANGRLVGYARLADGRDIGLELLRARAARVNEEAFSQRKIYLEATAR